MATPLPRIEVPLTLGEVARITEGTLHGSPSLPLVGLATDTRTLHPGALFVALQGERFDAHDHLPSAITAGAVALLVRHNTTVAPGTPYVAVDDTLVALARIARAHALGVRSGRVMPVIAISGAVGKTTTKELTAAALTAATNAPCHATAGNLNNLVGAPFTLLGMSTVHGSAVVECGSNAAGEIARIGEAVVPDVAMCMNADAAHTEGLGSIEAVADEEGSIFSFATKAVCGNADEPLSRARMKLAKPGVQAWLFGLAPEAHVRLVERTLLPNGRARLRFVIAEALCPTVKSVEVESALLGPAVATNIAAALCATAATGCSADALRAAAKALGSVSAVPGRLNLFELSNHTHVIDDTYNASPRAVRAALEAASEVAHARSSRLVVCMGDMLELGSLSVSEHREVGRHVADAKAVQFLAVGNDMQHAVETARERGVEVTWVRDSVEAARTVQTMVRAGDVVLVKGSRGMRMERCVASLMEVAT
jgi:UDP-N-acetylmuramoyl-tripeptide--D-alanyl-D-alanine ligase